MSRINEDIWFNAIKMFYDKGLYTTEQLDKFVQAKFIAEEQKNIIINGL